MRLPTQREIEIESLLTQTLKNFVQTKATALGYRKTPVKQVVSSGAPRQFHKFLSWLKVDCRIIGEINKVIGLKRLQSAG